MNEKTDQIEHELLVRRVKRAGFDPDRFKITSIVLVIAGSFLFTFFTLFLLIHRMTAGMCVFQSQ